MEDDKSTLTYPRADRDAEALAALPFRWQDLPAEDCGSVVPKFTPAQTINVGGRKAHLEDFIQYNTYGGVLCGIPNRPEREILGAIKKADSAFPFMTAKPFVVPPRVRIGQSRGLAWAVVPPVATIALFCDGSDMTLGVWFQDAYGLPTDPLVLDALETMDLKVHGVEWNP
jgi:hypothetical protein